MFDSHTSAARVLIVEDDPDIRELLKLHLQAEGFDILEAGDGPAAIEIAQECFPHLILLDIMMEGLNGYDTCKLLKQHERTLDIPVVFLTARIEEEAMVKGLTLGALDYIVKPFNPGILIPKVKTFVEMRRAQIKLKESEERYRSIFENIQDIYFESLLDGTIIEASPGLQTVSLYRRDELIGTSLYALYSSKAERDKLIAQLMAHGRLRDYEVHLKDKDGKVVTCATTCQLLLNNDGTPKKIVGSLHSFRKSGNASEA